MLRISISQIVNQMALPFHRGPTIRALVYCVVKICLCKSALSKNLDRASVHAAFFRLMNSIVVAA